MSKTKSGNPELLAQIEGYRFIKEDMQLILRIYTSKISVFFDSPHKDALKNLDAEYSKANRKASIGLDGAKKEMAEILDALFEDLQQKYYAELQDLDDLRRVVSAEAMDKKLRGKSNIFNELKQRVTEEKQVKWQPAALPASVVLKPVEISSAASLSSPTSKPAKVEVAAQPAAKEKAAALLSIKSSRNSLSSPPAKLPADDEKKGLMSTTRSGVLFKAPLSASSSPKAPSPKSQSPIVVAAGKKVVAQNEDLLDIAFNNYSKGIDGYLKRKKDSNSEIDLKKDFLLSALLMLGNLSTLTQERQAKMGAIKVTMLIAICSNNQDDIDAVRKFSDPVSIKEEVLLHLDRAKIFTESDFEIIRKQADALCAPQISAVAKPASSPRSPCIEAFAQQSSIQLQ